MKGAFALFSLRPLLRKKVRVALSAVSIGLGVATFVAVGATNRALVASLRETTRALSGSADLAVRGAAGPIPRALVEAIRGVEGVAVAVPISSFHVHVTDPPREGRVLLVGVDLRDDAAVRTYEGAAEVSSLHPLLLLGGNGALVSRPLAEDEGLRAGSPFEVSAETGRTALRVAGILEPKGIAGAFGARVLVVPIELADALRGVEGVCDRIDVALDDGVEAAEAKERIAAALDRGLFVEPPGGEFAEIDSMLASVRVAIGVTSVIALGFAVFVVYNSAALAAAERAREFGMLRALGATRRRVVLLFVGESVVVGALGALPGMLLGAALAQAATRTFVRDIVSTIFTVPETSARIGAAEILGGIAAGILAAGLAALHPAIAIGRIAPVEALREEIRVEPARVPPRVRVALAAAFLGMAGIAHLLGPARLPHAGWFTLGGLAAATFAGVWPAARALASPIGRAVRRISPISGRLAVDGFLRSPSRIGFTTGVIAAGFGMTLSVSLIVVSFQRALDDWMAETLSGDLWVFHGGFTGSGGFTPFAPEALEAIRSVPGVRRADAAQLRFVGIDGRSVMITAYDAASFPERGRFTYREGDEAATQREVPGRRAVLVSEGFAWNYGVGRGDSIRLPTPSGPVEYAVSGVVVDYGWPRGVVLMDRAVYREDFDDPFVSDSVVLLEPGADPDAVRRGILERLSERYPMAVLSLDEFRAHALAILDRFWTLTRGQVVATLLLAFLGVVNAAWIGSLVRSRELGLLRAIGGPRGAVFRIVAIEGLLVGVVGGLLALGLGVAIAKTDVSTLSLEFSGFTVPLRLGAEPILGAFGGAALTSLLAALAPARRAARLEILPAITYE